MTAPVSVVHVVAKTHLDLGFTALAAEVAARYRTEFFPRAVEVAAELRSAGGPERLVWTTGSWILHHALTEGTADERAVLEAAISRGDLAWHALPVTMHTELADAELFRSGLGIASELDDRFGRATTAAKMTDVPGHTRAMVPLLAEAGVQFLHLGVNPAWPVPEVPPVFRWRSPEGAEVVVAYQAGGYGGEVVVAGCTHALAFLHSGDNLGPPSAAEVRAGHIALAERYPGAEVRASTLDRFARALAASGAAAALPVVTAEIGDPWLFGAGSDPQKVARFRQLLRRRRTLGTDAVDRQLLLVVEHTWGLDQKEALPDDTHWAKRDLDDLRQQPAARRFESSWAEQRAYLDAAEIQLGPVSEEVDPASAVTSWQTVGPGPVLVGDWTLEVGSHGGLVTALHHPTGRPWADAAHALGVVGYQSFDEADYQRFYAGLRPTPADEWWARWDNTKPGIDAAGARSAWWSPSAVEVAVAEDPSAGWLRVRLAFPSEATTALGAPSGVTITWSPTHDGGLDAALSWQTKDANRLPEALWWSWNPLGVDPGTWTVEKLGQLVSPLDVVARGGRSLHAVGDGGLRAEGPGGSVVLTSPDAPLVAPGRPNLLDADPPLPDLTGGWHVLLHNNCWGTNFPMWNEGPARFRFHLAP